MGPQRARHRAAALQGQRQPRGIVQMRHRCGVPGAPSAIAMPTLIIRPCCGCVAVKIWVCLKASGAASCKCASAVECADASSQAWASVHGRAAA